MIYICEFLCRNNSHESFNSGFIDGFLSIYHDLCFYANRTHIDSIKSYLSLRNRNRNINLISFCEVCVPANIDFRSYFYIKKHIQPILDQVIKDDKNKLVFLSINPVILRALLNLSKIYKYRNIKYNIVMHGGLENVIPSRPKRAEKHCFFKKGENLNIFRITKRIIKKIISGYYISGILCSLINAITNIFFADYKVFLEKNDLSSFNFIVLSKHIQKNLPRYIKNQNFKTSLIYLPCIFPQIISQETNSYPKFAIFGYGTDNGLFEQFLDRLKVASPTKKYEIRVISMRHYRCPEGLNVTFVGKGDFIQRCEMEKCAEDIDFFLNFYGPDTYRLSCSGSIIEAIMYDKPVIYLRNECYDSFNSITGPIGFRAEDVYSFSQIVYHIIESWPSTLEKITEFKNNIKDVKEIIDITNQLKVNPLLIL